MVPLEAPARTLGVPGLSRRTMGAALAAFGASTLTARGPAHATVQLEEGEPAAPANGCASELEGLPEGPCVVAPREASNDLVIFLHGLMSLGRPSRHGWQQYVALLARGRSATFLVPEGLAGIGPGRDPGILAWPTSEAMRALYEDKLLEQWQGARKRLEAARERPFARVFVFGFSNGAYYATSLAARGRLTVDGYAMFGGGSGAPYLHKTARATRHRPPVFVGIGKQDVSRRDAQSLARMLGELKWPSHFVEDPGGHNVTGRQVQAALSFLRQPRG